MNRSKPAPLFLSQQYGAVALEFAIVFPVLLMLFAATVEITRYMQAREKLESAASNILDMINQNENVDTAGLQNLIAITPSLMEPFSIDTKEGYSGIVTVVAKGGAWACKPYTMWQYKAAKGNMGADSKVSSGEGKVADLSPINLSPNEQAVSFEIYYSYKPMLYLDVPLMGGEVFRATVMPTTMYRKVVAKPRYGSFTKHPSTGRVQPINCVN